MKAWLSTCGLIVFFLVGFSISFFSNHYQTDIAMNTMGRTQRDPAAIRKVYDFSNLDGSALSLASKQRILSGFESVRYGDSVGISLGHFVVRGPDGQKQFACRKYNKVILSFEGEGMAVGGEKPTMQVEGPCTEAEDINKIDPLVVPVAKIMSQPVADGEFDFRDNQNIKVRFSSVADQWPVQWVLTAVKLSNDDADEVTIEREEIRSMVGRPMIVNFQEY